MIMAFEMIRNGYVANASQEERQVLAGLARDLIFILGSDLEIELERREKIVEKLDNVDDFTDLDAVAEEELFSLWEQELAELAVVDHLDTPSAEEAGGVGLWEPDMPYPVDDALTRLLPDMSEDPQLATELRDLTAESITQAKIANLVQFYLTLHPDSDNDLVTVKNEEVAGYLASLTDIRLVLAARLGVYDSEIGESVYERATLFISHSPLDADNLPELDSPEDIMTVLYAMLSWWQESLLTAVRRKTLRKKEQ